MDAGKRSRDAEVEALNVTADWLHLRAFNKPAEVERIIQRRLDEGFKQAEAEFFARHTNTADDAGKGAA